MLLQSAEMVAKKLPVDDKIKHCLAKHSVFLKNVCYQYLIFFVSSNLLFFYEMYGYLQMYGYLLKYDWSPLSNWSRLQ